MTQIYDRPLTGPVTPSAARDRGQRSASEDRGTSTVPVQPNVTAIPLPAMSPDATANYYAQLATLGASLQTTLAASRAKRIGLKADARVARADAKGEAIDAMGATVNNAIERNSVGASYDVAARVGVRADLANAKAQIGNDTRAGLAESRLADQAAGLDYQLAGQQLEGARIADIQNQLADQLANNTLMSGLEAQTDAIRAMYESLANPPVPGKQTPGKRGKPGQFLGAIGSGFTAVGDDLAALLARIGASAAVPPSSFPGLNNAGMNPMANGRKR